VNPFVQALLLVLPCAASPFVAYEAFSPESRLRLVPRALRFLEARGWLSYDDSVGHGDPWW